MVAAGVRVTGVDTLSGVLVIGPEGYQWILIVRSVQCLFDSAEILGWTRIVVIILMVM